MRGKPTRLATPNAPALLPVFLALFFVIRGLPILALHRRDLPKRPKWTLALLGSAALPMVVVITTIGRRSVRCRRAPPPPWSARR
ncbi:hypothetical protein [Saccharopolyspora elongata]|uniref:Uncharacterized protein n=1 Tax=Saccharopolyspora elongata TaxID=2530387 RepID=A0A4R4YFA6_9PSEU|nr:hypothetical protein [Saccharopolyspora elongata]TDD43468.1 hypothetical protein E1288_26400 [Saccharopolyspora elongata]